MQLDLYLMAKCPFGAEMLRGLLPSVEGMSEQLALSVHYIGREQEGELVSMRGAEEVLADKLQLCARELGDERAFHSFLLCQVSAWESIPSGWDGCATQAGLDPAAVGACADGARGAELLRASFASTAAAGVDASPTLHIGGRPYEGGRTGPILARVLCDSASADSPAYCRELPEPQRVKVTLIGDRRCETPDCDASRLVTFLEHNLAGLEVRQVDWSEPEGPLMFAAAGQPYLPVAIFDGSIEANPAVFERLRGHLRELPEGRYVFPFGQSWAPSSQ